MTVPIRHQDRTHKTLSKEQREDLLESLRFDQIDARQMTIKTAHAKTCKWLLKNDQYIQWNDVTKSVDHHGFLWIKGKAGTGKSTLMKFAVANARRSMKDRLVLSFFFNARGEDLEKSTTGTYRSLLIQLLKPFPALQSVFDTLPVLSASKLGADHQWTIEPLQALLEQAIRSLGNLHVICFIDALDECDEKQVRGMIQFFEHIGDLALSSGVRFQVCLSSRHYPHITIRHGLELVLEGHEGHTQDIASYIDSELNIGKGKLAQQVRAELQEKASGIFMWVVLVVNILNTESDRGNVHKLRQKLQEIPGDLNDLFHDILTRDTNDKEQLILCIQWVLFAKKPLGPEQLYYAILSGTNPAAVTVRDPEEVTEDVIQRFILNSSKGLAEATASKDRRIQFIHESVRDFLLKENGLGKVWDEYGHNFQSQSHERLKQCCLNHVRLDVATPLKIPKDLPKASSQPAANLRTSVMQAYPFLEYAVHNVLYHADTAEGGGISQVNFLDSFPLPRWVKLDNLLEKHEVRRHAESVSLLYLLAELDMANLIGILDTAIRSRCMNVETERYGCPLFAAAATNSKMALDLCMNSTDVQRSGSNLVAAVHDRKYTNMSSWRASGRNFVYAKSKSLFSNAIELGHPGVLISVMGSGDFDIDSEHESRAVFNAVTDGSERAVRCMLAADSTLVNRKNDNQQSLLYVAAEHGHKALVNILLEHGADVNAQGGYYGNALQAASQMYEGSSKFVQLPLDKGASVVAQGGHYSNALQAASATRDSSQVVQLLLDKGADVNAQGGYYGNALQAASQYGHQEVVTILLNNGADVNVQGGSYGHALQAAALTYGNKEVVRLLLKHGADVNAQGGVIQSALKAALLIGDEDIIALLKSWGAKD